MARKGGGPSLIEANLERYLPHTSDDDDSIYRDAAEIEEAKKRDPLILLKTQLLKDNLISQSEDDIIRDEARRLVDEATEAAENADYPDTSEFNKHVYSD